MYKWQLLLFLVPFVATAQSDGEPAAPASLSGETISSSSVSDKKVMRIRQVPTESYFLSVKPKIGFLAAHHGVMGHLPKEGVKGIEISYYKRVGGNKAWNRSYNYPYMGATLYASTTGNSAILGKAIGVYGFMEFPLQTSRRHQLTGKLSCGLGYISKVFNQETNPKNVAMSTHVNALICLGIQGRIRLAERHQLIYSLDLTHMSNGATDVPNLGINMPNFGLGYAYLIRKKEVEPVDITAAPIRYHFLENWKLHVLGVVSSKEIFPTGGRHYPVYSLSIMGRTQFRPKVGMETALDIFSKQAVFGYKGYIPKTQWSILQVGLYAAYVLPLDRFQFVLGMGVYVKDRYQPDGPLYHRIGMRYQFGNGITANVVLKSHWAKADYVEWGIGYTFKHRKK